MTSSQRPVLWKPEVYLAQANNARTQWYFYLGMAAALCLFNLVLYAAIREPSYLLYVLSLLSVVWWVSSGGGGNGWSYQLFWPNSPVMEQAAWPAAIVAALTFSMWFVAYFLDLSRTMPKVFRMVLATQFVAVSLQGSRVLLTILQVRDAAWWMNIAFVGGNAASLPLILLMFTAMGIQAWQGSRAARILLIAWGRWCWLVWDLR